MMATTPFYLPQPKSAHAISQLPEELSPLSPSLLSMYPTQPARSDEQQESQLIPAPTEKFSLFA
jgi:hypothetical protein